MVHHHSKREDRLLLTGSRHQASQPYKAPVAPNFGAVCLLERLDFSICSHGHKSLHVIPTVFCMSH